MNVSFRHLSLAPAVLAVLVASAFAAPSAHASAICGQGTYAYAGYSGTTETHGVSASIGQAGPLAVHAGHVAGWVGVVDPDSEGAWLQAGLSALPGDATSSIYVEYAVRGRAPVYRTVATGIAPGAVHSFAVLEQRSDPSWWVVSIDGRTAGPPLHLPGSDHGWIAQVLGESWAGLTSGTCNAYSYAFSKVRLIGARSSTGLPGSLEADPNYLVTDLSSSSFVAAGFGIVGGHTSAADLSVSPLTFPRTAIGDAIGAAFRPPRS